MAGKWNTIDLSINCTIYLYLVSYLKHILRQLGSTKWERHSFAKKMFCCDKSKDALINDKTPKHSHEPFIISQNNTFQAKSWEHGCPQKMWTRTIDLNTQQPLSLKRGYFGGVSVSLAGKVFPLTPRKIFSWLCEHSSASFVTIIILEKSKAFEVMNHG